MLDARTAVWNLRKVIPPQLFLFLEAKWTMVGRDGLERIARQPLPELFLIPFFAQRRREHILRALKTGGIHIVQGEVKVLRASFRVGGQSPIARLANLFERVVAGKMHDVN